MTKTIGLLLLAVLAAAQDRRKVDINAETPEGQLLQQIGQEQDLAKKIGMLEEFTVKYAKHNSIAWVWGQLHAGYVKTNQPDKLFGATEKLLGFDAADSEIAYGALQAAVAKNDPDAIAKWAGATVESAKKGEKLPKPSNEDDEEMWKYRVDFSKQVQKRAEYEIFTAALRSEPARRVQLADSLASLNPESEYLPQLEDQKFLALRQLGQTDKAIEQATRLAGKGAANEDMLLMLANASFEAKDSEKALGYSDKLAELLKTKPAPQGVSPEDWEKKKNTTLGVGLWLKGMILAGQSKWAETDVVLREAAPLLQGNEQLLGPALFNLGLANYRLGQGGPKVKPDMKRIKEALQYSQQCAAIKGPFQAQAQKNVGVIRQQFGVR